MALLDINFTMRGASREDYDALYTGAREIGQVAWASESQFYLLTSLNFNDAYNYLRLDMIEEDFLKVAEVCGGVRMGGYFPGAVNALFEQAHAQGLITLHVSQRARPSLNSPSAAHGLLRHQVK